MIKNLWPIWVMLFYVFFYSIVKVNHFLCRFIILLHLISSLALTRSFFVPNAYVHIELIDCILLLSFELKTVLLISSVKTFCLSRLNLCCVFLIDLLFFINSLILSLSVLFSSRYFVLFSV